MGTRDPEEPTLVAAPPVEAVMRKAGAAAHLHQAAPTALIVKAIRARKRRGD